MKILWLTWKDRENPLAGGAEVVNEELAARLVADGHEVYFITAGFPGACQTDGRDGFTITRLGGRYTVYWKVYLYYRKHFQDWPNLVIDEMNTIPFFARFYVKQPTLLFIYQLCREIWFYQLPFPFSLVGYIFEPLYLWMLRRSRVVTISESTKQDLLRYGFQNDQIDIISIGTELTPIEDIDKIKKFRHPTMLSLGNIRPMKRTMDQVKAFELAKQRVPKLKLKIAGSASSSYGQKVLKAIETSPYKKDIEYIGFVSNAERIKLMRRSHFITVTSVKEGWGLIVTEAASQGTPAVVYDVDGLRDSVRRGDLGMIAKHNTPAGLADAIVLLLSNKDCYTDIQLKAFRSSYEMTFEHSYQQFRRILKRP